MPTSKIKPVKLFAKRDDQRKRPSDLSGWKPVTFGEKVREQPRQTKQSAGAGGVLESLFADPCMHKGWTRATIAMTTGRVTETNWRDRESE